jgi:hypothetical protein
MTIFPSNYIVLFTAIVLHNDHGRHKTISRQENRTEHITMKTLFRPGKGNSFLNDLHLQLIDSTVLSDALVVRSATVILTAKFNKIR